MADRLVAICGGGDWADASVEHLIVPAGVDLAAQHAAWRRWYEGEYVPSYRRGEKPEYVCFSSWLKRQVGARDAVDGEDYEEFWDH